MIKIEEKQKSLKIKESTHKKLGMLGNKNETFDDIINKLIADYENQKEQLPLVKIPREPLEFQNIEGIKEEFNYDDNDIPYGRGVKKSMDEDLDEHLDEFGNTYY